jgi:hypothetical protein
MIKAQTSKSFGGTMRHNNQLLTYVLLLRFGRIPDSEAPHPVMNYTSIAKIIRKPVSTVIELVKTALTASMHGFSEVNYSRSKLKQHQIGYLVSAQTLQECAHLSLVERAQMFHRQFGEVKISPTTIRRIYLKHKIRFKNIKRGKREIDFSEPHYLSLFHRMRALLK